jgi:hypothetical protein
MKYIKLYEDIDWEDWNEEENSELIFDLDNYPYPLFEDLKINNRVEFIYKNKSYFATVINKYHSKYLTFEFDDYIDGHNGWNIGKQGYCWNYENNNYDIEWLINKLNKLNKI